MAYLDYAATTPMYPEAAAAMGPFLSDTFGNPSGAHGDARAAKTALEAAREELAAALGAEPSEIVLTGGGTEADNLAVKGPARAARDAGDGVVTTAFEHKGVLAPCHRLERGLRRPGGGVRARRVPERVRQKRLHCRNCLGIHGCCGRVVEIRHRRASVGSRFGGPFLVPAGSRARTAAFRPTLTG